MTELIRTTAVFIRTNTDTAEALKAAVTLADAIDGNIPLSAAVSGLSALTGRKSEVKDCVPNTATALVVSCIRELRSTLTVHNRELADDIADVLQALPENKYFSDKKTTAAFNSSCIDKFNTKHGIKLPHIV